VDINDGGVDLGGLTLVGTPGSSDTTANTFIEYKGVFGGASSSDVGIVNLKQPLELSIYQKDAGFKQIVYRIYAEVDDFSDNSDSIKYRYFLDDPLCTASTAKEYQRLKLDMSKWLYPDTIDNNGLGTINELSHDFVTIKNTIMRLNNVKFH